MNGTGTADVVVVGGGLEGTGAAWELARRGAGKVELFERHAVAAAGTAKSSGIVRCHYSIRSLAAMAWAGVQFFENAEEILGQDIGFQQTGYVVGVGGPDVAALRANLEMQRSLGIEVDSIDHDAVAQLWPCARLDDFAAFGYEPRGGFGDGHRTAQAFAAAARREGARIHQNTAVTRLLVEGDRVRGVELADGGRVHAPAVVVAAGPWSTSLLADVGIDLPIEVLREEIVMVAPGRDLPGTPVLSDLVSLQYVRPERNGEILFGNSDLSGPATADPDSYSNTLTPALLERAVDKLADRLPGLPDAAVASGYAGCYDVTPDFNPAISLTGVEGLVVAAGFSGHGFKIAPAVARLVADLVLTGRSLAPDVPEPDFRLARFAEGTLLTSPHPYVSAGQLR
jgi:sarcosine oxidase, subunit beta